LKHLKRILVIKENRSVLFR